MIVSNKTIKSYSNYQNSIQYPERLAFSFSSLSRTKGLRIFTRNTSRIMTINSKLDVIYFVKELKIDGFYACYYNILNKNIYILTLSSIDKFTLLQLDHYNNYYFICDNYLSCTDEFLLRQYVRVRGNLIILK